MAADKPFLRTLAGEATWPPPIWLMRQAGRYLPEYRAVRKTASSFLTFCYTPDLAVEVTLQPIRRFGFDAAILFSDILVVPDGLGQTVGFVEGEGPRLDALADEHALNKLSAARVTGHLAPVYEAVRVLARTLPETVALIGFAGSPWTLATYMVEGRGGTDFGRTLAWAYSRPDSFQRLIDLLVEAITRHLIEQAKAGAEALQVFDSWAGVLSESAFERWVIEPTRKIVDAVHAACPGVPVIGFPRGAGALYVPYAERTRVDAVSLDASVPLAFARERLQSRLAVQGNLDNRALLQGGDLLNAECARILAAFKGGPFVFNLGHGVIKETPIGHVEKLVALVRAGA